jgi:hypothetical protein
MIFFPCFAVSDAYPELRLLNKLKPPKQNTLDAEFNEIVRELESVVDVKNSVIANNSGDNK